MAWWDVRNEVRWGRVVPVGYRSGCGIIWVLHYMEDNSYILEGLVYLEVGVGVPGSGGWSTWEWGVRVAERGR